MCNGYLSLSNKANSTKHHLNFPKLGRHACHSEENLLTKDN